MADIAAPYPPAPTNVPADLTSPATSYRVRVIVVLTSLFLFAFLYLGLVTGTAYLCWRSFSSIGPTEPKSRSVPGLLFDSSVTEERLTVLYNNAVDQRRQDMIDDEAFLQIVERDVLPPWQVHLQQLELVGNLPPEEQQLVQQRIAFFRQRQKGWELFTQAIRHGAPESANQARETLRDSELLARQFADNAEQYLRRRSRRNGAFKGSELIVGIVSGLLCLFLVKGFFKWNRSDQTRRLEVTEKDQPVLFAFIRQLCHDTQAPLPHRVYLTSEVNAAVFYHESLLSLFLPTPKNLIIGMGLVNQLNLSEFKAVLAHEFGHFSQNSMKLGSYVYVSNRVISDIVFGRDWLDKVVAFLSGLDLRIAILAWVFRGILWALRRTLEGLFKVINFANSALSRQMEFNADLVAVSVTGSDALIHGLAKLDFASSCLQQALNDLAVAADHKLYSRDLFYHQSRANEYLRTLNNNPLLGQPPALPTDPEQIIEVFPPHDFSVPKMWATHPSNHDREVNAKRRYFRSPIDERSPWILFQDASAVRAELTLQLYQSVLPGQEVKMEAPEVVQAFIDAEHAETTYNPRYHGFYDYRHLNPGDLDELIQSVTNEVSDTELLAEQRALLYGDDFRNRMETHKAREKDYKRLAALAHGAVELTGSDFQFRGERYQIADTQRLIEQLSKELNEDIEWMTGMDRQVFLVHYRLARQINDETVQELEQRYRFHLAVQYMHRQLLTHNQEVSATLNQLVGQTQLTRSRFNSAVEVFSRAEVALRHWLEAAGQLRVPALKNMTSGQVLGPFLLSRPPVPMSFHRGNELDMNKVGLLLETLGEVLDKTQRILTRSMGGLLVLQETIEDRAALRTQSQSN